MAFEWEILSVDKKIKFRTPTGNVSVAVGAKVDMNGLATLSVTDAHNDQVSIVFAPNDGYPTLMSGMRAGDRIQFEEGG